MSLRQWFLDKLPLNKRKNKGLMADLASGSSTITPELTTASLRKNFKIGLISLLAALFIIPCALFFPQLRQWVFATLWHTAETLDSTGNVGLYGAMALDSSNQPSVVYYDKTNFTVKYATRATNGVWTVENIETFGADYGTGINTAKNTKFGIALSPVDNKMSVTYCNYAQSGVPAGSLFRYSHRVGGGAGTCSGGSNWNCGSADANFVDSCPMRMTSLAFATTSSLPTIAYIKTDTLMLSEFNNVSWTTSTVVSSNPGLVFDQNQAVLSYRADGAPIIFFIQNDGAATNAVKYTYRNNADWTWSSPATLFTEAWDNSSVQPYTLSVVKDPTTADLFHIAAGLNADLHYTTLNSSFVVGANTHVDTGAFTWNSIMIQSGGNPAIGYYDQSGGSLKYAAYDGASWTTETVGTNRGSYVSLVPSAADSQPRMFYYDVAGGNAQYIAQSSGNTAPDAPTTLYAASSTAQIGDSNPTQVATTTPTFSAVYVDADSGDIATKAEVQITTATDNFATITHWDSGQTTLSGTVAAGARSGNLKYDTFGTTPLLTLALSDDGVVSTTPDIVYHWRIRFWDQDGNAGTWSASNTFTLYDAPTKPTVLYSSTTTAQSGDATPTQLATTTPVFSALFNDRILADTGNQAEIQVTTATDDFVTITHWDSGQTVLGTPAVQAARTTGMKYGSFGSAPTLALSLGDNAALGTVVDTIYHWRMRMWNQAGVAGDWSTSSTFTILDAPARALTGGSGSLHPGAANSVTIMRDNTQPYVGELMELTMSTAGGAYVHVATSTAVNNGAAYESFDLVDVFAYKTVYDFQLRYYNVVGYSPYMASADRHATAPAPPVLSGEVASCSAVNLTWSDVIASEAGYDYIVNNGSVFYPGQTTPSLVFSGLEAGKQYGFVVTSEDLANDHAQSPSNTVTVRTFACVPTVSAIQTSSQNVTLQWSNQGNGVVYNIENITTGQAATTTANSYVFTGLAQQIYAFRVRAMNVDNVYSAFSSTVSITVVITSNGVYSTPDVAPTGSFVIVPTVAGPLSWVTNSTKVNLDVTSANAGWVGISNDPTFASPTWFVVHGKDLIPWTLAYVKQGEQAQRTAYVRFRSITGALESALSNQSIGIDLWRTASPVILFPQDNAQSSVGKITYSGTAGPGAKVRLVANDKDTMKHYDLGETTTLASGEWTLVSEQTFPSGAYTIDAVAIDAAGNSSLHVFITVHVNVVAAVLPQSPTVIFPVANSTITTKTITTKGISEPFSHIVIKNNGPQQNDIGTLLTEANSSGQWSVVIPMLLDEGSHTYSYFSKNNADVLSDPQVVTFTINLNPVILEEPKPIIIKDPAQLPWLPKIVTPVPSQEPSPLAPLPPPVLTSFDNATKSPSASGSSHENPGANLNGNNNSIAAISDAALGGLTDIKTEAQDLLNKSVTAFASTENFSAASNEVIKKISTQTRQTVQRTTETAKLIAHVARTAADAPEVQTTNKVIVVPTAAAVGAASVGAAVNVPQILLYFRFLFTQPFALLNRRRRKQWGMVYNAITKMPIDLAVVRLVDTVNNRIVQSQVTDRAGRFQFFAQPGIYKVEITKADFNFPAPYLVGKEVDGNLADLYSGGTITVEKAGPLSFNVPLDPIGVQKTIKQVLKESTKKHFASILSMGGVIITGISFVITPTPLVGTFLVAHIGSFFLFRRLAIGKRPKGWGIVSDANLKGPVERAVVRIFDTQYNKLLETQVTDVKGHYGFLVGKNQYYVMAEHQGHEKFVSKPVTIENETEGGVVGFDINLAHGSGDMDHLLVTPLAITAAASETSIALSTQYVPKVLVPTQEQPTGVGAALLTHIGASSKTNNTIEASSIPHVESVPSQATATFRRVEAAASVNIKNFNASASVQSTADVSGAAKLLLPVSFGSRDMIITGCGKKTDLLPEIISDGNFLSALDKKI